MANMKPDNKWQYQFPRAHRFSRTAPSKQIKKIKEEVRELNKAIRQHNNDEAIAEAMDVIQATETLIRNYNRTAHYLDRMKVEHVQKDQVRGYYDITNTVV